MRYFHWTLAQFWGHPHADHCTEDDGDTRQKWFGVKEKLYYIDVDFDTDDT